MEKKQLKTYKSNKPFFRKSKPFYLKKRRKKNMFFVYRKKAFSKNKRKAYIQKKDRLFRKWVRRKVARLILKNFFKKKQCVKVYIYSTNNNTIITVVGMDNKVMFRMSAGSIRKGMFKKSVRKRSFPAASVGEEVVKKLKELKVSSVTLYLKGLKKNRKHAARVFEKSNIVIRAIKDITPIAHNGCRIKKRRRL